MSRMPKALESAFIEGYFRFATPEDVPETASARRALALSQMEFGAVRRRGQIRLRVFNPGDDGSALGSSHTVIEAITDDSPFIVDSLTMQLNAVSQGVLVKLHSVLDVTRTRDGRLVECEVAGADSDDPGEPHEQTESWTHFEIPRVPDERDLKRIERQLIEVLEDVKAAVRDWPLMLKSLRNAANELRAFCDVDNVEEAGHFLDWIADHHFTLLGYCLLPKRRQKSAKQSAASRRDAPLGLLRTAARRKMLSRFRRGDKPAALTITKSPIRSTVHRPALLDDIRIDAYDESGHVRGEHRFLGLFTSLAYNENPKDIPLLRTKVETIMQRSGLYESGHRSKALRHILDTFPRDALIQSSVEELERIGTGVLNIEERRKIRLFLTESAYGDFFSCLIYLPRDGYSGQARRRVETVLQQLLDGTLVDSQLTISESTLARLSLMIQRHDRTAEPPDITLLQQKVTDAAASWLDRARLALLEQFPEERALSLHHRFVASFPVTYQETVARERIGRDFEAVASIADGEVGEHFELVAEGSAGTFSVFVAGAAVPLHIANPILENMGVRLLQESSFELTSNATGIRIHDFRVESVHAELLEADGLAERFEDCFASVLHGHVENDAFNQLVVTAGLNCHQIVVLRAYCKYLLQCRSKFSQAYMIDTLRRYPAIVRSYLALFTAYFDPAIESAKRDAAISQQLADIRRELDSAASLDDDRILKMFSSVLQATLRTSYFQQTAANEGRLSFKLDPARIPGLPEPRPKFEIFVYSPEVEGVHLRCGEIARGGIRWSDRREDFRTEVLGLMKAQQVKNTVIVPAGAKGGFVLKSPPAGDRAKLQQHAVDCYRAFLRGMLDLTDNIVAGKNVGPGDTVCRDSPDPYLVVAADKGTATFSDTANAIAAEYGFWLGDAFASGGSAGYDHKKMGITARGAWESVKRHFRETGVDSQSEPFTVIGIGDMSGDVFGNGMLLSDQIRLIAAFNHRHIFIDPDPDPAVSFAERQRLFALPRSGWDDYDRELLSKGGGVYDRQSKSVSLSAEARAALSIDANALTPYELIRAILLAPADLLFNGGVGTYVKASSESDNDAADPANDAVRVDGRDLRVKIVAEGGNLGLTQRGRIEFALKGGRLNTDFIDNSGGVDSSDREVNIKILLSDAIRRKQLQAGRRNALLASMTDEVARLVLTSNYQQTQALSMMVSKAYERIGEHARLIRMLETRGILNRSVEFLPGEEEIEERKRAGAGFTRPELAVILSYAKIELYDSLTRTDIPDEKHCEAEIEAYFPERLSKRFEKLIRSHRLRREIAAMLISSSMINRMGPFFSLRAQEDTGADTADVARAYAIVRGLFNTREIWRGIEALDGEVQAQVQYDCFFECSRMLRRAVYWFLHRRSRHQNIETSIERKKSEVSTVLAKLPTVLCGWAKRSFERDKNNFESLGVPERLGERIAALRLMTPVLDIAEVSRDLEIEPLTVAGIYFELGRGLRLDWIREQIEELAVEGHWRAMARGTLRETLGREQRALLHGILRKAGRDDHRSALAEWLADHNTEITRLKRTLDEMQASGQMDFATLSIALREISRLR